MGIGWVSGIVPGTGNATAGRKGRAQSLPRKTDAYSKYKIIEQPINTITVKDKVTQEPRGDGLC